MILGVLALACLAYRPVLGQQSADDCLSLQRSTACHAYGEYYVGLAGLSQRFPFLANVNDVSSFDANMTNYAKSASDYYLPVGCSHTSTNQTLPYARYSLTRLCAGVIQDPDYSLPCNRKYGKAPPPLCKSTCTDWLSSVANITANQDVCPYQQERNDSLTRLASQCDDWQGYNGTTFCISGAENESDNCGFQDDLAGACAYCDQNSSDRCCLSVKSCNKLSTGAIVGIVIACLVGVGVVGLALYFFGCRKRRVRKDKFTFTTYMPPPTQDMSHDFHNGSTTADSTGSRRALVGGEPNHHNSLRTSQPPPSQTPFMTEQHQEYEDEEQLQQQPEFFEVVHPYPPQMGDELGLRVGDIVCLAMLFDDGWALGFNVTTGLKGVFPAVCVVPASEELLEQLLQPATASVAGEQTYSSKTLIEDEGEQGATTTSTAGDNSRGNLPPPLSINIQKIREDFRRSMSLRSTPSTASNSYTNISPLPRAELTNHNTIPKRTASMRAAYGYHEADSPSSPTTHTPFMEVPLLSGDHRQRMVAPPPAGPSMMTATGETYEMHRQSNNRISKHEQHANDSSISTPWIPPK
ncbi:hypothetical protein DFQ28_001968 [Apophysomyces sp. BC1034]|nr:hypothetical protein DFQ30_002372 [Apophysomyces sp. BC1015]KAG0179907.1 hypothetical protein DFQ29_001487 [Apophysomyces sp. BC1021]KAG0190495.1 hypothetical protein DFQ28_001968 [Apophysomyces sp. BC1034]